MFLKKYGSLTFFAKNTEGVVKDSVCFLKIFREPKILVKLYALALKSKKAGSNLPAFLWFNQLF
jgi:hypothetical protein